MHTLNGVPEWHSGVLRDGGSATLKWGVSTNNDLTVGGRELVLTTAGNVGFGTATWGTGAARVLGLFAGTAPTTSLPDLVQLWTADVGGVAGQGGLHLRTEASHLHVIGNTTGFRTNCSAALTAGASYASLNVSGGLLLVGTSSVQEQAQAGLVPSWVVSTDASRTARVHPPRLR